MLTVYDRVRKPGGTANANSQTQPETQLIVNIDARQKRKSREEQPGRSKRVKISLGDAMDLGD